MIKNIIVVLNLEEWYGQAENVDIAKGKYRAVRNWDEAKKQLKRQYHGK